MKAKILGMFYCFLAFLCVVLIFAQPYDDKKKSVDFDANTWICRNSKCEKSSNPSNDEETMSLETCNMLCYSDIPIWPAPKKIDIINRHSTLFIKEHMFLKIYSPVDIKDDLEKAANLFLGNLKGSTGPYKLTDNEKQIVKLNLHVESLERKLSSKTNESYVLYSQYFPNEVLVNIYSPNYFGARHGLETLSQLIWYDTISNKFRILHDIKVTDEPKFNHRGLLIDVSRNYFSVDLLKKAVDGMAATKLNVIHLHISDSESFPLVLPNNVLFAQNGAYGVNMTYSPEDIEEFIEYARIRGIRTIIEVDAPSHVYPKAWPEDQTLCGDQDVFKATLNPDNPKTLDTLQSIYEDLFTLGTDKDTFHIGNDEVVLECWRNTKAAQSENNLNFVWANFSNQMMERVRSANNGIIPKNIVMWSSPLTDHYMKILNFQNDLVVQYWFGQFAHIINDGYKIIFSTVGQWYLDCGFGPWKKKDSHGSCDPYTHWMKFYRYRPWKDFPNKLNQVLGGEACLWTEQVSPDDMETRLWPRSAAMAERVWSDPESFDETDVYRRIEIHSARLKQRGYRVAAIWPKFCDYYPEKC